MAGNNTGLLIGHVLALVGLFIVAWGLYSLSGPVSALVVFKKPIFWGFVVLALGSCITLGVVREKASTANASAPPASVTPAPRS